MMLYIMQCNIKMKYLWLGNAVLENDLNIMINKGYKSTSSQVSQWNLINGLEITRQCIFDIISGSVIPHYPSYEDIILHEKKWQHKTGADDYSIGFLNIKYINKLICQYNMIAMAKQWYKKHNDEGEIVIFVYSMRSPVMAAAYAIKKMCSNAKILLIIPDLPEYMDVSESFLKKCLKRIDAIQQKKFLKTFDGYLVYAETMIDYLSLDKNRCLLMEGSISIDECALRL